MIIDGAPNGTDTGAGNIISGNDADGVNVHVSGATGNRIEGNSIFDNGGLGIDLYESAQNASGVTANDANDPDTGPNNLQNYPAITSANTPSGETTIEGTLNSTPDDSFTLQFFSSPTADPSGFGEGETFVDETEVTTDAVDGNATFSFTTATPIDVGRVVTATATSITTDDTSEFSEAVEVEDTTPPTVTRVVPVEDATGVGLDTNIKAYFSEPMSADSINPNTLKLFAPGSATPVAATVTYDAATMKATLDPSANLHQRGTRYKAKVTTGARDLADNQLDQDPGATRRRCGLSPPEPRKGPTRDTPTRGSSRRVGE